MDKGLYLYGFMRKCSFENLNGMKSIDNFHNLFPVVFEDIFAVVSEIDMEEYSEVKMNEKLEDLHWVAEKAGIHYYIINALARDHYFLPMKFCTAFKNTEDLNERISNIKEQIKDAFNYFEDKEEWTLKVFIDRKKLSESKMGKEPDRVELGSIKDELWRTLKDKTVNIKVNEILLPQVPGRKLDMVMNTALLLHKDNLNELCTFLKELKGKFKLSYMFFELVGPWPFYNFAGMFIK